MAGSVLVRVSGACKALFHPVAFVIARLGREIMLIISDNGWEGEAAKYKPIKSGKCQMGVHKFTFVKNSVSLSNRFPSASVYSELKLSQPRW